MTLVCVQVQFTIWSSWKEICVRQECRGVLHQINHKLSNVFTNLNLIGDPRMHQCLITFQLPSNLCWTWHLWSGLCLNPGTSRSDFRHYCQSRACPPATCKMRIDTMGVSKILVELCAFVIKCLFCNNKQLAFEDVSFLKMESQGWNCQNVDFDMLPPRLQAAPLNQWDLLWFHHHPPQW